MDRRSFTLTAAGSLAAWALGCRAGNRGGSSGKPKSVRVAFFPNITHAAALHASATGAFAKAIGDLRLEERVFSAGPAEIEALFAGEVDFGYIGPGPAVNGYVKSRGDALRIVSGAASGGTGLVARKGLGIRSVGDLAGRKVAVPQTGGTQDISLRHALTDAKLAPKDRGGNVEILQYAPADTLARLKQGEIDAAWMAEPWVARLIAEADVELVLDERSLWPDKRFSTAVVVVRRQFLEDQPELVRSLLATHKDSVGALREKPKDSIPLVAKKIAELSAGKAIPENVLKDAFSRTEITDDILEESILQFADHANALGYLSVGRDGLKDLFQTIG